MAVFSFSTASKRPKDEETIKAIKDYCDKKCINFSGVVVEQLTNWWEAQNEPSRRTDKV